MTSKVYHAIIDIFLVLIWPKDLPLPLLVTFMDQYCFCFCQKFLLVCKLEVGYTILSDPKEILIHVS